MEKYEFSHEDYLMYEFHFVNEKENKIVGTASKVKCQKHDKTFKEVLKDKKEMSKFLKQFIELEVDASKLEMYNGEFINNKYERRISDIIYKENGKEIYYLIEHQSKVDINMPQRILDYCMELMREVKKNLNLKDATNPLIVPIVIYTGTNKWTVSENFSDTQKVEEKYKKYAINLKYKLIDINKYSKEELTNKNTKMTSMMMLEKCKDKDELKSTTIEIWKKADTARRGWLENLIKYVFPKILDDEEILRLIKGEEKLPMEDLIERIKANEKKKEKALIKKTIRTIIKNMLKENLDEDTIIKFTNAKRKEIEKIRMELEAN